MITERAMQGVDEVLHRAVRSRLVLHAGDRCEIVRTRVHDASEFSERDFVVLTITSIGFRMLTMIHIADNASTRGYYGRGSPGNGFMDSFLELANLFCGAINQELVNCFPDLGMSTPYYLSGKCALHMPALKPTCMLSYAIAINDDVQMTVNVCLCAEAPLDFTLPVTATVQATGELELF